MNVQTNTQNRKVLAEELSRLIGEPYRYLGVPSCAYQVGPYTINRDGSISGDDFEAIHSFLVENDYIVLTPAGVKCHALFNPFTCYFFADDVYRVVTDEKGEQDS